MSVSLTSTSTSTTLSSNGVDVFSVGSDNEAQARVNGVMQPLSSLASIGIGQTWQDVTASRSTGVTYTNTTGKPISVSIIITTLSAVSLSGSLVVDGGFISRHLTITGAVGQFATLLAIVPNGGTYSLSLGASNSVSIWKELS